MKKTLALTLLSGAVLAFSAMPAAAGHHEGGDHGGKKAKHFEKMDANADGMISETEFLEAHKARFKDMDTNGDGNISKEEAKAKGDEKRAKMKERMKKRKDTRASE